MVYFKGEPNTLEMISFKFRFEFRVARNVQTNRYLMFAAGSKTNAAMRFFMSLLPHKSTSSKDRAPRYRLIVCRGRRTSYWSFRALKPDKVQFV
jgi:hypothetical protein